MGQIHSSKPVLLIMAAFSRYPSAGLGEAEGGTGVWTGCARQRAVRHEETDFYEPTMGTGLRKTFLAFERLIDPAVLSTSSIARTIGKRNTRP